MKYRRDGGLEVPLLDDEVFAPTILSMHRASLVFSGTHHSRKFFVELFLKNCVDFVGDQDEYIPDSPGRANQENTFNPSDNSNKVTKHASALNKCTIHEKISHATKQLEAAAVLLLHQLVSTK